MLICIFLKRWNEAWHCIVQNNLRNEELKQTSTKWVHWPPWYITSYFILYLIAATISVSRFDRSFQNICSIFLMQWTRKLEKSYYNNLKHCFLHPGLQMRKCELRANRVFYWIFIIFKNIPCLESRKRESISHYTMYTGMCI